MRILTLVLLFSGSGAFAQGVDSLVIDLNNGGRVAIALRDISKITFDSTLAGVNSNSSTQDFYIIEPSFPNPAQNSSEITFYSGEWNSCLVTIHDLHGKRVHQVQLPGFKGKNTFKWNCQDSDGRQVLDGVYLIKIESGNKSAFTKIIIKG